MFKHVTRSYYLMIALVLLFASSSALAARELHPAKGRALHPGLRRRGALKLEHKPAVSVRHRASHGTDASTTTVLLGDDRVESQGGLLRAGQAEAFRLRAHATGTAAAALVYIGPGNAATTVVVGVYSNGGRHPHSLMSVGTATSPKPGAWTAVPVKPIEVVRGRVYWLAILGEGGELRYRDSATGSCLTDASSRKNLRIPPASWRSRVRYANCPASAYLTTADVPPSSKPGPLEGELHEEPGLLEDLPPQAITPPDVSGTPEVGEVLDGSPGVWTGSPTSYAYQWDDCNTSGESCFQIAGATASSYTLVPSDAGHTIRVAVTATNAAGSTEADSGDTEVVEAEPPVIPPTNTAPPEVSGIAQEGQTLTASEGSWSESPSSYAYQWEDCDTSGESCAAISGATSSSYKLAASDVGHTIRVVVTATNAGGSTEAESGATEVVEAEPPVAAPTNTALPKVSGSAVEAQTLSASTGSWTGSPSSYTYEWEDCNTSGESCAAIGGATSSSYKLAASDVGHTVRVVVTATNAGGSTKASSAATGTVLPLAPTNTALPKVSGSVVEAQTLSTSTGSWTGSPSSYTYQWEDCNTSGESCSNVSGATSSSYKLAPSDVGHTVRVVVTATNAGGSTKASSAATGTVLPLAPSNTALPKVSGSAVEAQTLTASEGSWTGSPSSYTYQWEDCNSSGESCSNVSGATSSSYKLAPSDVGHTLRVVVTATNAGGSTKASSAATGTVLPLAPTNTALPKVTGSVVEAQTLSASTGSWTGSPSSYAYQWEDCNTSGESCAAIGGATSSSYKLASSDVGHTVRVVVTATNAGGSTKASSAATGTVLPLAPSNTALPKVSGSAVEAQTLTASEGSWTGSPSSYAYQWEDCNSSGESCSNVSGATSSSYKLASGDVGHTLRVVVTATNAGGSTKASSAATGTVLPLAPTNTVLPKVSGGAEEGQTLGASSGSWTGSPTSYAYQWEDCNTSGGECSSIGGATSSSYKLAAGDVGHTVRVVVTATNAGGSTKANSDATAVVVVPPAPTNVVRPKVSGGAEEGQTLGASSGSWTGSPTSYAYQWEDCNTSGGECSSIGGATSSSYKLLSGDVGHTVRVVVTATNAGGSTKESSEATATVTVAGSSGSQIYVSQSGAGGEAGTSCAAAHRLRWFNEESHWGTGGTQIGPGTVVHLCGTFTEPVETKGSGSAGKPVEVRFEAGAKIAMGGNGCPGAGCINVYGNSEYVTINGGVDGQIENTERSYEREKEEGPVTTGIEANGCRHCNFENLEIGPLYVTEKGDVVGNTEIRGIKIRPEGGNTEYITVDNDYFHDMGWSVTIEAEPSSNHIYVEHNTFYRQTHAFIPGASFNGGDIGPVVFAHNTDYGNINWEDGEHDTNHVDGVHCFAGYGDYPHYNTEPGKGLYIYDNYITMEGYNVESPVFLEGANNHTVCGDKTSPLWVFNNVIGGTTANGLITDGSGEPRIFNNTIIGATEHSCVEVTSDTESGRELAIQNVRLKNNLTTSCHVLIDAQKQLLAANELGYNLWANSGNEALKCRTEQGNAGEHGTPYSLAEYSAWKACIGQGEEHSMTMGNAKVNLEETPGEFGKPESGSEAIGHGVNLTSLCSETPEEALCKNINGEGRPTAGAWNVGAY